MKILSGFALIFHVLDVVELTGRNGGGLCGDATMLRDSLVVVSMP
jgi:hypothetical protein